MNPLILQEGCPCGKRHESGVRELLLGRDALLELPGALLRLGTRRVFLLADRSTYAVAGERTEALLSAHGIPFSHYVIEKDHPEPDESTLGTAVMHFDASADTVLAVGSGVIGDVAKLLARTAGAHYAIVATAPSMDGYASASSSMVVDGLKMSLPSVCPELIVGDPAILATAPDEMLVSGLGDMLAKYISICEWRIAHIVTGEYYCESIAALMRASLKKCVENAKGLLRREQEALLAVFEGLVTAGMAMEYAGLSRPASGVEHYFSHVWDMRALAFGAPASTHGIQCAVATLLSARLYESIKQTVPDREKALAYVGSFDLSAYRASLSQFLGKGAEAMIALDEKEGKYDKDKHRARLDIILRSWEQILTVIREEVPSPGMIEALLISIGCPTRPCELGIDESLLSVMLHATKDIRDKYVLSRLAFDLGVIDELPI